MGPTSARLTCSPVSKSIAPGIETLTPKDKDKDGNGDPPLAAFARYGHHIRKLKIHWILSSKLLVEQAMYWIRVPGCRFEARLFKNLKEFRGERDVFDKVDFWTLLDLLPLGIESLSISSHLFPLPIPLPEPRKNMRVLEPDGKTSLGRTTAAHSGHGRIESNYPLEDWMQEELRQCYPKLESFRSTLDPEYIEEIRRPREDFDHTHQALVANRHLKAFDSIMNFVKVDELLRQPWTCMGLELLVCRIVGVDRLEEEEEAVVARVMVPGYSTELTEGETRAVEKFHRCRAKHHGVYDRLASLKRLKHLDLGYETRYPTWADRGKRYRGDNGKLYVRYNHGPTFDTLELTLESGLSRLAALKDLRMFGFERINHRIGKAELDWMAKSWPKLELMYGLDKDRLFKNEHAKEKKTALRKYFRQLRPDVVHDSLFTDLHYLYNVKDWDP
ncbi:MAG: hypothetical protein JOS17DRAFT_793982 [Linnemannia elongata]|nr:MAG: hypothetical protein JOS17DRAFT_793982 [Linnemannia elongata]